MNVASRLPEMKRDWLDWPFFGESHRTFAGSLDRDVARAVDGELLQECTQPGDVLDRCSTNFDHAVEVWPTSCSRAPYLRAASPW